jgi:hypothetical protein
MLRKLLPALFASALLLASHGVHALPAGQPGDPGDEPPVDPCIESPELCDPEPPPPPTSICDRFPGLCVNEDPPKAQPEPPAPAFSHTFSGSAKVRGKGFKDSEPYTLQMNFETTALTFLAMDADGHVYGGNLVPKGKTGSKFRLFLDGSSTDALAADVAERAATASGRSVGTALGESSKLILKLNDDGSISLKMKSEVLVTDVGEVSFKANLVELAR